MTACAFIKKSGLCLIVWVDPVGYAVGVGVEEGAGRGVVVQDDADMGCDRLAEFVGGCEAAGFDEPGLDGGWGGCPDVVVPVYEDVRSLCAFALHGSEDVVPPPAVGAAEGRAEDNEEVGVGEEIGVLAFVLCSVGLG